MNNKDFFKQVLEDEIPDLESVRKKCIETDIDEKKARLFSVFKNSLTAKRLIPACACLIIVLLSVAAIYSSVNPDNYIISNPSQYTDKSFSKKQAPLKTDKIISDKENHEKNVKNSEEINSNTATQTTAAEITSTEIFTHMVENNNLFSAPKTATSSLSFISFDNLKTVASSIIYQNEMVIISNGDDSEILTIPNEKLSMIIDERRIITFSVNEKQLAFSSGILKNHAADSLTGLSFNVSYNGIDYEIGYSTYRTTKDVSAEDEFIANTGYIYKVSDQNLFHTSIDGYYVYIKTTSVDTDAVQEFLNSISFSFEALN